MEQTTFQELSIDAHFADPRSGLVGEFVKITDTIAITWRTGWLHNEPFMNGEKFIVHPQARVRTVDTSEQ